MKRFSFNVFHCKKEMACLKIASGIKNFDDIGMRQAVGQFGFPDEAFDENRIVILIETVLHQFQGALLLEQQMFCKVDFSHTAPSQQTDDGGGNALDTGFEDSSFAFLEEFIFDFFADLHRVPADVAAARKAALFARFGIDRFAEVKVANLSTGMKQKVSLVISIVHDPDIIIFDEPTNGLDVITAKTVTDYLLELRERGKTVIVSTHIFSLVEKLCDRVGIIIDGKMTVCDTLENVCGGMTLEDRFFELYSAAMGEEV